MAWRLVEIPDAEVVDADLSDADLIGISVALRSVSETTVDDVYSRAWAKLQPSVQKSLECELWRWTPAILDHWEQTRKGPNDYQTLKTGAKNARPKS